VLASGSRDGCVKLWKIDDALSEAGLNVSEFGSFSPCPDRKSDAITALSFAPTPLDDKDALLAVGLESGRIELFRVPLSPSSPPQLLLQFPKSLCHIATVTKLAWRPLTRESSKTTTRKLQLASSSMDCGCRIFEVLLQANGS
jgi:WD40 repeat protein